MTTASGSRERTGFVWETVAGTTPTNPVFNVVRKTSNSVKPKREFSASDELRADRQIIHTVGGPIDIAGELGFVLSYGAHDDFLEAALCGTWNANVLKVGTTRRTGTMERYFADIANADKPYKRFAGCEVGGFKLQSTDQGRFTGTFSFIGRTYSQDTAILTGATYGAENTNHPLVHYTGSSFTEGGSATTALTEISLELDNKLEAIKTLGMDAMREAAIGQSIVKGSATFCFEDEVMVDKLMNQTESSLAFTLTDAAGNSLEFSLPRIKYTDGFPEVKGPGAIFLTMPFDALYDETAASNIVITRTPHA